MPEQALRMTSVLKHAGEQMIKCCLNLLSRNCRYCAPDKTDAA